MNRGCRRCFYFIEKFNNFQTNNFNDLVISFGRFITKIFVKLNFSLEIDIGTR